MLYILYCLLVFNPRASRCSQWAVTGFLNQKHSVFIEFSKFVKTVVGFVITTLMFVILLRYLCRQTVLEHRQTRPLRVNETLLH